MLVKRESPLKTLVDLSLAGTRNSPQAVAPLGDWQAKSMICTHHHLRPAFDSVLSPPPHPTLPGIPPP